jgi:hypothetical protein
VVENKLLLSEYAQQLREFFTTEGAYNLPYLEDQSYYTQFSEKKSDEEQIDDQHVARLDKRVPFRNMFSPVTGQIELGAPLVVDDKSSKLADRVARQQLANSVRSGENPLVAQGRDKELADNRIAISTFIGKGDVTKPFSVKSAMSRVLDILAENNDFREAEALGHSARKVMGSKMLQGVNVQFVDWEAYSRIASANENGYSAATYIPRDKTIYVSDVFGDIDGTPMENLVASIVHEGIHVPTKAFLDVGYAYYTNNAKAIELLPDRTAGKEMGQMFGKLNDVLLPLLRKKAGPEHFYGLSSVDELLSEVGSDASLRDFLRGVKLTKGDRKRLGIHKSAIRTAFDWIVDLLAKLLGIGSNQKPELLEYTDRQLKKVIELADGLSLMGRVIHETNVRGIDRLDIFASVKATNYGDMERGKTTFKWIDGTTRFHISDRQKKVEIIDPNTGEFRPLREMVTKGTYELSEEKKLGEILKHPELFQAYPQLESISVKPIDESQAGEWDSKTNTIGLNPKTADVSVLIHEIQHAVDTIEGYDSGTNTFMADMLFELVTELVRPPIDFKATAEGFNDWKAKTVQGLRDLSKQAQELARSRNLGVLPEARDDQSGKKLGKIIAPQFSMSSLMGQMPSAELHTVFLVVRMFDTFADVFEQSTLPDNIDPFMLRAIGYFDYMKFKGKSLGNVIYRYNFGEITARTQQKLVKGADPTALIGDAGVGVIEAMAPGPGKASIASDGSGYSDKSKLVDLITAKKFGDSWGVPSKKHLSKLRQSLVEVEGPVDALTTYKDGFDTLGKALKRLENYAEQKSSSSSIARPRPDDGARVYHEAQSIGLNELIAGMTSAYREAQQYLPSDMNLNGFIEEYGKLDLGWGRKKVGDAVKAQDKNLSPYGLKSGMIRLTDVGRNSVAKNFGARAAVAFIESTRLSARNEISTLVDLIEQAEKKSKSIKVLFKALEDNRLAANEDLVDAFKQKLVNISEQRLEKYLEYLPNEILNQDDLNMLQKISKDEILGALEAIIEADGSVENLGKEEMNDALRDMNLRWFSGSSTQASLARVALMETIRSSKDIISLMRMSRNKLGDDQIEFFNAVKDMLSQATVEGVESVSLKAPQRVATKFKELKEARIQQLEMEEIRPVYNKKLEALRTLDDMLKLRSDKYRFALGELENFDIRDGVKIKAIMTDDSGREYVGSYEVKFKNGEIENRKEFIKVNRKTLEFLRNNKETYQTEPWYDLMREQAEAALALPVTQQWSAVRRSAWMAGLESVNQRFSRLGYEGKKLAGMTARTVALYRDLISKAQFHAKEFNRAYENVLSALDVDGQTFYTGMYQEIFWWFDNNPQYAGNEDLAFSEMWKAVRKKANLPDRSSLDDKARRAVRTLVEKVIAARDYEARTNRDLGNRIKDDEVKVQSYLDGEKMVDFYRMPLDMGYATIPRAVNDSKVLSLVEYMTHEDRGEYRWDGSAGAMPVDEMIRALQRQGEREEIGNELNKLFSEEVVIRFMEPFINAGSRKSQFYGPADADGWGAELSNEFVASQWEASGRKLVPFLDRLYNSLSTTAERGDDKKRGDWYVSFYSQMHARFRELNRTARHINSKAEGETRESEAMKHTPRSLDGRQVEARLPKEFFLYDMYDETSTSIRMAMFAGASVFGRDGTKATEAFAEGRKSLRKSFDLLASVISTVTGQPPSKPEGSYPNAIKRKAYAELKRLGHSNPAEKFKKIHNEAVAYGELRTTFQHLRKYYGSNNEAGPYKDARFLLELLGTQSLAVLNNPKSSFMQGMSLFEFPLAFRGANKMALKGTAKALGNFVNQTFGGMAEAMGIQMDRVGNHAANLNSTHFRIEEMALPLRDYITQVGSGGELTDKTNMKRYLRILQDISTHHKARGTRAPIDLSTLVTGIFPYVNNVVNHSVGVGAMYVYQDLVLKVAKHIENNGLTDAEFTEITAEDMGLGQSSMEWIVGEKDGYTNANNMLIEAGAPSITRLAYDYIDRKASNPKAEVIKYDTGLLINQVAMNNMAGEGFNSKPAWLYTNPIMKYFAFFLGWPLGKVARDNRFIFRGDTDSVNTYAAFIKYLGLMSAIYLPVGLSFAFMIDWYDEEVLGKPNNLPPITPWATIPVVGPFVAASDKNFSLYGLTSRMAKAGTPYGMGFDLMNSIMAKGDPYSAAREFSLDSRIFAFSIFKNIYDAMGNWMHQGEFDWGNVGRPLVYAMGGNSIIQMTDATNQFFQFDNEEARVADYIGVRNYIKSTAYLMGMELRAPGKGYSRPSPVSVNVKQMERAAYAGDAQDFAKQYAEAIEAAREEIERTGRTETPEQIVRSRFAQRGLRTGVTRGKIPDNDWMALLQILPEDIREKVQRYEANHKYFLDEISIRRKNPYSLNQMRALMANGMMP